MVITIVLSLAAFGSTGSAAWADTAFTVTTTGDGSDANPGDGVCEITVGIGDCGLRAAGDEADAVGEPTVINIPAGTYQLSALGEIDITVPVTLNGAGSGATVIVGNPGDRVLRTHDATTIVGLDVTGGDAYDGGGLWASGPTEIVDSAFYANRADHWGGGVYVDSAVPVVIRNSVFHDNEAITGAAVLALGALEFLDGSDAHDNTTSSGGGALYADADLRVTDSSVGDNLSTGGFAAGALVFGNAFITRSEFSGNTAPAAGALAVYGTFTLDHATISDNTADTGSAGGVLSYAGTGTITDSILTGNQALAGYGGGAYAETGITVLRSTISGNAALYGGGVSTNGPASIDSSTFNNNTAESDAAVETFSTLTIVNSTIVDNAATVSGGAIYTVGGGSIRYSTLTGNSAPIGSIVQTDPAGSTTISSSILSTPSADGGCDGPSVTGDRNVSDGSASGCLLTGAADIEVADLGLGALTLNAPGATATRALLVGSPAVDYVPTCAVPVDQRGVPRADGATTGSACDAGAYEAVQETTTTTSSTSTTSTTIEGGPVAPTTTPIGPTLPATGGSPGAGAALAAIVGGVGLLVVRAARRAR